MHQRRPFRDVPVPASVPTISKPKNAEAHVAPVRPDPLPIPCKKTAIILGGRGTAADESVGLMMSPCPVACAFFNNARPLTAMGNRTSRRSPTAFFKPALSVKTAIRFFSPFGPRTRRFSGLSLSILIT